MVDRPEPEPRSPGKAALAALAIAQGSTMKAIAARLGLSERTIRRWAKTAAFKARVEALRSEYTDATLGRLADASSAAVGVLIDLMAEADTDSTRLAAAKAILDKLPIISEYADLARRIAELERRHQE